MKKVLITNYWASHQTKPKKKFNSLMSLLGKRVSQISESKSAPREIRETIFLIQSSFNRHRGRKDLLKV